MGIELTWHETYHIVKTWLHSDNQIRYLPILSHVHQTTFRVTNHKTKHYRYILAHEAFGS